MAIFSLNDYKYQTHHTVKDTFFILHLLPFLKTSEMPFKRVVSKNKTPLGHGHSRDVQPSRHGHNIPSASPRHSRDTIRALSRPERWTLLQHFPEKDLDWMLANEDLQISDFIDFTLASAPLFTKEDENDIYKFDLEPKLRRCIICRNREAKHEMVKCRGCYEWSCFTHYDIQGRSDPRRRFWKCPGCLSRNPGGPTLHTATEPELISDNLFEDTDNETA